MIDITAPIPNALQHQPTIREVLIDALKEADIHKRGKKQAPRHTVCPMENAYPELREYLIRTTALHNPKARKEMLRDLERNPNLFITSSDAHFVGPNMSQTLLQLYDAGSFTYDQRKSLQWVKRIPGKNIEEFLKENPDNRRKLAEYFAAYPETVERLFLQAAYCGSIEGTAHLPDFYAHNIMISEREEGGYDISLIDTVSPEAEISHRIRCDNKQTVYAGTKGARRYIESKALNGWEKNSDRARAFDMFFYDTFPLNSERKPLAEETTDRLYAIVKKAKEDALMCIEYGWTPEEWKGLSSGFERFAEITDELKECIGKEDATGKVYFQHVQGAKAISLDAPAFALKYALDEMAKNAMPEEGKAR